MTVSGGPALFSTSIFINIVIGCVFFSIFLVIGALFPSTWHIKSAIKRRDIFSSWDSGFEAEHWVTTRNQSPHRTLNWCRILFFFYLFFWFCILAPHNCRGEKKNKTMNTIEYPETLEPQIIMSKKRFLIKPNWKEMLSDWYALRFCLPNLLLVMKHHFVL